MDAKSWMKTPEFPGQDIFARVTFFISSRIEIRMTLIKQNNPEEEANSELKSPSTRVTAPVYSISDLKSDHAPGLQHQDLDKNSP